MDQSADFEFDVRENCSSTEAIMQERKRMEFLASDLYQTLAKHTITRAIRVIVAHVRAHETLQRFLWDIGQKSTRVVSCAVNLYFEARSKAVQLEIRGDNDDVVHVWPHNWTYPVKLPKIVEMHQLDDFLTALLIDRDAQLSHISIEAPDVDCSMIQVMSTTPSAK